MEMRSYTVITWHDMPWLDMTWHDWHDLTWLDMTSDVMTHSIAWHDETCTWMSTHLITTCHKMCTWIITSFPSFDSTSNWTWYDMEEMTWYYMAWSPHTINASIISLWHENMMNPSHIIHLLGSVRNNVWNRFLKYNDISSIKVSTVWRMTVIIPDFICFINWIWSSDVHRYPLNLGPKKLEAWSWA